MANLLLRVQCNIEDWKGNPGDGIISLPSSLKTFLYFRMVRRMVKQPADVKIFLDQEGGLLADPSQ